MHSCWKSGKNMAIRASPFLCSAATSDLWTDSKQDRTQDWLLDIWQRILWVGGEDNIKVHAM